MWKCRGGPKRGVERVLHRERLWWGGTKTQIESFKWDRMELKGIIDAVSQNWFQKSHQSPVYFKRFDWSSLFVKEVLRGWNWMLRWFEVVWKGWILHGIIESHMAPLKYGLLHLEIAIAWQHRDACKVVGKDRTWKLGVFHSCQEELSKFQMEKTWKKPSRSQDLKCISIHFLSFREGFYSLQASKQSTFWSGECFNEPLMSLCNMVNGNDVETQDEILPHHLSAATCGSNMHTILIICIIVYMHDIMN